MRASERSSSSDPAAAATHQNASMYIRRDHVSVERLHREFGGAERAADASAIRWLAATAEGSNAPGRHDVGGCNRSAITVTHSILGRTHTPPGKRNTLLREIRGYLHINAQPLHTACYDSADTFAQVGHFTDYPDRLL